MSFFQPLLIEQNVIDITDYINMYRAKNQAPPLLYDDAIKLFSQNWSYHMCSNNLFQHSGSPNYGENISYYEGYGTDPMILLRLAIDGWYNEISLYDFNNPGFSEATGHFTCLVWLASTSFGIGISINETTGQAYVCFNTSPAGNIIGHFQENVLPITGEIIVNPLPEPQPEPQPQSVEEPVYQTDYSEPNSPSDPDTDISVNNHYLYPNFPYYPYHYPYYYPYPYNYPYNYLYSEANPYSVIGNDISKNNIHHVVSLPPPCMPPSIPPSMHPHIRGCKNIHHIHHVHHINRPRHIQKPIIKKANPIHIHIRKSSNNPSMNPSLQINPLQII